MGKKYWLHRISHNWAVSYELFDKGYLSLGWKVYSKTGILDAARRRETEFEKVYESLNSKKYKSRWNMWYLSKFNIGDIVVVPLYDGLFSVCRVIEPAKSIKEIETEIGEFTDKNGKLITWENGLLKRKGEVETIDLGFVVKVEVIRTEKRNEYADSALTSRMKMRQTNGDISDLSKSIDNVINAEKPINFYENAISQGASYLLERIQNDLDDNKFEKLVKAYLDKVGADYTYIPPKNERGKVDKADADVIAVFETLQLTIQVQVKHYVNTTDAWAVEQILGYKEQLEDKNADLFHAEEDDYTIIPWVITSSELFSDKAIHAAQENNVRLINGYEFARMLMDAGLANIDKEL